MNRSAESRERERIRKQKAAWRTTHRTINAEGEVTSERQVPAPTLSPIAIPGAVPKFTTTWYDRNGVADRQVVRHEPEKVAAALAIEAFLTSLRANVVFADPVPAPAGPVDDDFAILYGVGDQHKGMLSWGAETGADWDTKISERMLNAAMDNLVERVPPAATAVVALMGDFLHYDGYDSVTPKGKNQLDSDTRLPKMIDAGCRCIRYLVFRALQKHKAVHLVFVPGNHDPVGTAWLIRAFDMLYENDPRVSVDTSPRPAHYVRFGANLIGLVHGDKNKLESLPLLMATDDPISWGATTHRFWYTGHVHHNSAKSIMGCRVETLAVLPPGDAWSHGKGYRAEREMKAVVFHKEFGRHSEVFVNPAMLEDA